MRRAEDSSKENKSALAQLISHTKNVERAVTLSQQDMVTKKEQQGTKIQELSHKLASVTQVEFQYVTFITRKKHLST